MPEPTPTVDLIRGRLRYRLDGTSGARCRAVRPNGRPATYTARRYSVAAVALRWCALGYGDVQIAITARSGARMGSAGAYRQFPASQDEAIQAVRELAALRGPGSGVWRRFLRRLDAQSVIVPNTPEPPPEEGAPMEDDEAFYTLDMTTQNVVDLRGEVEALERSRGRMVGIVSNEAGGIIAYAIGEDNAATIVQGLRTGKDPLIEFCFAYLRDARTEGAVEVDASDAVIGREANRLAQRIYQLGSSFVANEFDDREVTTNA